MTNCGFQQWFIVHPRGMAPFGMYQRRVYTAGIVRAQTAIPAGRGNELWTQSPMDTSPSGQFAYCLVISPKRLFAKFQALFWQLRRALLLTATCPPVCPSHSWAKP